MKQNQAKLKISCDELKWLYVPDVLYAEYEDCKRYMQVIVPYRNHWESNEKFPLVVFIPGSAWYKQEMHNSIPSYSKLAERGIVTAIVQYRESTISPYPAQVHDINCAIKFLLEKADQLHIDVNNIFIAGNSSGGHITLMTSFMKAHGIIQGEYEIKGIIAEEAPTDMFLSEDEDRDMPEWLPKDFRPTFDLLGGKEISEDVELARSASSEMYITKDVELPRILLIHGIDDCQVSIQHSRQLFQQLKNADKDVIFYELEECDHGGAAFWSKEVIDIINSFVMLTSNVSELI